MSRPLDNRRLQYLSAMGIQLWERRTPSSSPGSTEAVASVEPESVPADRRARDTAEAPPAPAVSTPDVPSGEVRVAELPLEHEAALEAFSLPSVPGPDATPDVDADPFAASPSGKGGQVPEQPTLTDPALPGWEGLATAVAACTHCPALSRSRRQVVFGAGDRQAEWMIIGDAPRLDEEETGEPFSGGTGALLGNMLRAIGLARSQVYSVNVLKCRVPDGCAPTPAEIERCARFLRRQIELVNPGVLLVAGRFAAQTLLQSDQPLDHLRGRVHRLDGRPLVVTYHPADLLEAPMEKRKVWADLRLARQILPER